MSFVCVCCVWQYSIKFSFHPHEHCASTNRDLGMPGHGSPPNLLCDRMIEHLLFPIQAWESHKKQRKKRYIRETELNLVPYHNDFSNMNLNWLQNLNYLEVWKQLGWNLLNSRNRIPYLFHNCCRIGKMTAPHRITFTIT